MDAVDRAQVLEEAERDEMIRRTRLHPAPDNQGGKTCSLCGCEIEPLRLRFMPHARTCFDCQSELEDHRGL